MTLLRNTFEGGTNGTTLVGGTTSNNTGGASGDQFATVSRTGAAVLQFSTDRPTYGSMGVKCTAAVGETALAGFTGLNGVNAAAQIDKWDPTALPSTGEIGLIQFRNSGASPVSATVNVGADGKFLGYDGNGSFISGSTTTGAVTAGGGPYLVDSRVEVVGAGTGKFYLLVRNAAGTTVAQFSMTAVDLGTDPITAVRFLKVSSSGAIANQYADNVAAQDGVTAFISQAVNAPPTANAGANQSIAAGTTLTLSGSGSDGDGTITSYAWTKVSGPTATITNASSSTATVASIPAGRYVFRLTVTDNSGATGTDDVNVYVNALTVRPDVEVSNAGGYTNVGGAASRVAALADESDATYVETPDNPSSAVYEYSLAPLADGQTTITYRLAVSATTPARTCVTSLVVGSTVIASDTHSTTDTSAPITTTFQDYTLALSPTQLSALAGIAGARDNLKLRHVWS